MQQKEWEALLDRLKKNDSSLRSLDLRRNKLGNEGVLMLASLVLDGNLSLMSLNLCEWEVANRKIPSKETATVNLIQTCSGLASFNPKPNLASETDARSNASVNRSLKLWSA